VVKFELVRDTITGDLTQAAKELGRVPLGAYKIFRSHTPVRSGNARRKTTLNNTTIEANYAYATRLDRGASNQAPDGMTNPTKAYLNKTLDNIFKGR